MREGAAAAGRGWAEAAGSSASGRMRARGGEGAGARRSPPRLAVGELLSGADCAEGDVVGDRLRVWGGARRQPSASKTPNTQPRRARPATASTSLAAAPCQWLTRSAPAWRPSSRRRRPRRRWRRGRRGRSCSSSGRRPPRGCARGVAHAAGGQDHSSAASLSPPHLAAAAHGPQRERRGLRWERKGSPHRPRISSMHTIARSAYSPSLPAISAAATATP